MYENILVSLEKSRFDMDAIESSIEIAEKHNGNITLLNIFDLIPLSKHDKQKEYRNLKEKNEIYIEPMLNKIQERNIPCKVVEMTGKSGMGICNYAENNPVDIVVMPLSDSTKTGIYNSFEEQYVFSHCSKQVLFVRSGTKNILKDRKILVVDDMPDMLDTVEDLLDMCVVHKAKDHETALKLIEMNKYDIVVLDIIGVDGFSILKKTVRMGIPSVMLTSNDLTKEALKKAAKLGASAFLPKEKVSDLEIFLSDIIKNNGKPIWEKLFERMSKYFEKELGWSPTDERELVEKFSNVEGSKKP
jgi:DNA-binding NarL/FixJ family response regulator